MDVTEDKLTLTFSNEANISLRDIEQLFSRFSKTVKAHDYKGRIFVRLGNAEEAANAIECLSCVMKINYAKKRYGNAKRLTRSEDPALAENSHAQVNFNPYREKNFEVERVGTLKQNEKNSINENGLCRSNSEFTHSISNFSKNFPDHGSIPQAESVSSSKTHDSSFQSGIESTSVGALIDMKDIKKVYPIVLANLPSAFTLDDVLNLVEETQPFAMTELRHTKGQNLKFCEIYLKNIEDIAYLKRKLDGFVISKKKLMVTEPSACLTGAKWII